MEKRYRRSIYLNYLFRCIGIALSFFSVKVQLAYLGTTLYGMWATVLSIIGWMSYGDLGIANGLRNELAAAIGREDHLKEKEIIGSAFSIISKLSACLLCIFVGVIEILFRLNIVETTLRTPIYITSLFFCINFVLGISTSLAYSYQASWIPGAVLVTNSVLAILSVLGLLKSGGEANLVLFSIVYGCAGLISNLFGFVLLRRCGIKLPKIRELKKKSSSESTKMIASIGIRFFIIQLCGLVLDSTDNLIINRLFGADAVTEYSLVNKVFSTGNQFFSILLISLWSAVTIRYVKGETKWIRNEISRIRKLWIVYACGVWLVAVLFQTIMNIWLGKEAIQFQTSLVLVFAAYETVHSFGAIYVNVVNGIGSIKEEMILSIVGAIINIPLSVFLGKNCGMGSMGVRAATLFCRLGTVTLIPYVAYRELRKKEAELSSATGS